MKGVLTEKVGPFPLWVWLGIMTAIAVAYYVYARRKANATAQAATSSTTPAGQVPEFVIQNQFPPGDQGPAGPPGPPGKPGAPGASVDPQREGYSVVTFDEAVADRKLGAQVLALTAPPDKGGRLVPWDGKRGPQLYISSAWLSKHHRPHEAAGHNAQAISNQAAQSQKAAARPAGSSPTGVEAPNPPQPARRA